MYIWGTTYHFLVFVSLFQSNDAGPAYNKVVNETEKEAELEDDLNEPKSANENRPLLIVTSASAPPSPLPARKDFRQKSKDKVCVCIQVFLVGYLSLAKFPRSANMLSRQVN